MALSSIIEEPGWYTAAIVRTGTRIHGLCSRCRLADVYKRQVFDVPAEKGVTRDITRGQLLPGGAHLVKDWRQSGYLLDVYKRQSHTLVVFPKASQSSSA